MFMLLVKFHGGLPENEALGLMNERLPRFRAVPGLVRNLFDSEESLLRYRGSELAASIRPTLRVEGTPLREILELHFPLRVDPGAVPGR